MTRKHLHRQGEFVPVYKTAGRKIRCQNRTDQKARLQPEKQDKVSNTLSEFAIIRQIGHMSDKNIPCHRIHPKSQAQTIYRFQQGATKRRKE